MNLFVKCTRVKVVGVDEVEGFHKHEDAGEGVARVLSAQAGVGGDEEEEQLGDILVLPVHRNIYIINYILDLANVAIHYSLNIIFIDFFQRQIYFYTNHSISYLN